MQQAGMATREFTWEFEQFAQDVGMAEEDAKVHLVSALKPGHPCLLGYIRHHAWW